MSDRNSSGLFPLVLVPRYTRFPRMRSIGVVSLISMQRLMTCMNGCSRRTELSEFVDGKYALFRVSKMGCIPCSCHSNVLV